MIDNSSIQIRTAIAADMAAVHALICELAEYEKAPDEVINTISNLERDGFGPNKVFDCIVAVHKEVVVGFALYYTSYSTWKGRCLYLEDFLVTESYRRKGIGELLFKTVQEIAKERNVLRFEWQVLDWNVPAINFYRKHAADLDEEWINCRINPSK